MNNFIDNDENVLRIYEHIVNYLESFPSAIKQTKIADMQNFYDNQNTIFNVDFDRLFDKSFLNQFDLYVDINTLNLDNNNTYNYNSSLHAPQMLNSNEEILLQINAINNQYIVLRGIFSLLSGVPIIKNIYPDILPSTEIMNIYINIRNKLVLHDQKYNFIHYRYEHDFINHFKINNLPTLEYLINNLPFNNSNNIIYIATTNINNLLKNINTSKILIYKDESEIKNLNFEQRGFINFMFGKNSDELYGHPNSSFSVILNELKNTNNYY